MKQPYILRSSRPTQNTFSFSPLYSNAAIKCIKIKLTFNATRYYTGAPASQCKINACTFCPVKLKREKRRVHLNTHHTKHLKKKSFILGSEHHYSVCPLFAAIIKISYLVWMLIQKHSQSFLDCNQLSIFPFIVFIEVLVLCLFSPFLGLCVAFL